MSLPNSASARPRSLRAALLGAVAIVAVGGLALEALPPFAQAATAATSLSPAGPASFADVVDRVKGAVVSVKVKISEDASDDQGAAPHMPNAAPGGPMDRFFRQFGEGQDGDNELPGMRPRHPRLSMAQGSGFFISADGYIVTNNHVVDHATEVTVTTVGGKTMSAKVIGTDPKTDLALLKVKEGGDFPFVSFASEAPRVGDWVIAVGNPFGLGGTVTAGIVSARGRDIGSGPYDDFLQIDAPVNRGNSGGPTFNGEGEVVGVNTAIFSPSGGSVGIGFAISSDVVKSVVQSLKDHGTVARGWLGVEIQPVSDDIADSLGVKPASGALVAKDQPGSPALAAGVRPGDIITSVNGEAVADPKELARKIALLGPKATAELGIVRNGAAQTLSVKLGEMAGEKEAKAETTAQPGEPTELARLGLSVEPARAGREGVTVAQVDPDGVAGQKGLQTGDVIVDAGGKPVASAADITAALDAAKASGKKAVLLRVKSGENFRYVAISTQAAS
ncbi:MAG: Do family serine endopeptidase [Roseiarcus sp.]